MITRFFNWLNSLFVSKYAASFARGALKAAGGFLLAIGLEPQVVEQFVSVSEPVLVGVMLFLVGQLMSFAEKGKR